MPEPTRYDWINTDPIGIEPAEQGRYMLYSEHAALRQLAEAVIREYRHGATVIGEHDFHLSVRELEEHLK